MRGFNGMRVGEGEDMETGIGVGGRGNMKRVICKRV